MAQRAHEHATTSAEERYTRCTSHNNCLRTYTLTAPLLLLPLVPPLLLLLSSMSELLAYTHAVVVSSFGSGFGSGFGSSFGSVLEAQYR
jgi:hypothetical protein